MKNYFSRKNRGLTLLEVLVVIAVISLLISVTLPALLTAKESAARATCVNNIKNVVIAINSYSSSFQCYPAACGLPNYSNQNKKLMLKEYSLFTQILGQLDSIVLYNAINFDQPLNDFPTHSTRTSSENTTAIYASVNALICPSSNRGHFLGHNCSSNLRVNLGVERWSTYQSETNAGSVGSYSNTTQASVLDGLSNTVAVSEKLIGSTNQNVFDPFSGVAEGALSLPFNIDESLEQCKHRTTDEKFTSATGLTWSVGTFTQTCYNHSDVPNSLTSDCSLPASDPYAGHFAARSYHPNGVNAGFLDGSVKFFNNSISLSVWRAVGTRQGNEISNPSF